jgi:hypothetical protein
MRQEWRGDGGEGGDETSKAGGDDEKRKELRRSNE